MSSGVCEDFSWHYSGRTWEYYQSYLARFSNNPKRILDIGCGLGLFLECCKHNDIEGVGLELSEQGLAEVAEKGLIAIKQDLGKPFSALDDESFDAVFSFQVIEHLPADMQMNTLRESYRVLKKGGQVHVDSPCRFYKAAQMAPTHIGLLSPSELRGMLQAAGFEKFNMGYNFPQSFDDLPDDVVKEIWEKYHPDILSQTATVHAYKI